MATKDDDPDRPSNWDDSAAQGRLTHGVMGAPYLNTHQPLVGQHIDNLVPPTGDVGNPAQDFVEGRKPSRQTPPRNPTGDQFADVTGTQPAK